MGFPDLTASAVIDGLKDYVLDGFLIRKDGHFLMERLKAEFFATQSLGQRDEIREKMFPKEADLDKKILEGVAGCGGFGGVGDVAGDRLKHTPPHLKPDYADCHSEKSQDKSGDPLLPGPFIAERDRGENQPHYRERYVQPVERTQKWEEGYERSQHREYPPDYA